MNGYDNDDGSLTDNENNGLESRCDSLLLRAEDLLKNKSDNLTESIKILEELMKIIRHNPSFKLKYIDEIESLGNKLKTPEVEVPPSEVLKEALVNEEKVSQPLKKETVVENVFH